MALWESPAVDALDVGYDVIVLIGQSNMSGRGAAFDATHYDPIDPRIFQYGTSGTYANVISQAIEPLAMIDVPTGMGPGIVFARWYLRTVPVNRSVLLIPVAKGGTAFESGTTRWKITTSPVGNNLYETAISQTLAAVTLAGANTRIVAALWLQGETDGDNLVSQATYAADLDALISGLRTRLGVPGLPFIVGQMVPEYLGTGTRSAINSAHLATPTRVTRTAVALAPTASNNNDGNHFNAPGQRIIGRRMFDAYRRIITNTPAPAAPTDVTLSSSPLLVISATRNNPAGASIASSSVITVAGDNGEPNIFVVTTSALTITGLRTDTTDATVTSSSSLTVSASVPQPLVDTVTVSAARAYACRKVVLAYAGSAVRVRRSSDNTEQDIGFATGGDLDTAALLTFAGAGSAFVKIWYDQSGNARDLTQSTNSAQGRIVNAGSLETVGAKAAVVFTGSSYYSGASAGMYAAGSMSLLLVLNAPTQTGTIGRIISESSTTSTTPQYAPLTVASVTGARAAAFIRTDSNVALLTDSGGAPPDLFNGSAHQGSTVDNGSSVAQFTDGSAAKTDSYTRSGTFTVPTFGVGALVRASVGSFFTGSVAELVVWHSALSSTNRQAGETNQKSYYGTP